MSDTGLVIAHLDAPSPGQTVAIDQPFRGHGWVVAEHEIGEISLYLDTLLLCHARPTEPAPELAARFPGWQTNGFDFTARIPPGTQTGDDPRLALHVRAGADDTRLLKEVPIVLDRSGLDADRATQGDGVDVLFPRWRISDGAAAPMLDALTRLGAMPVFDVFVDQSGHLPTMSAALDQTLRSLRGQAYTKWRWRLGTEMTPAETEGDFFLVLRPGDRLGADALLQFALAVALHRQADFIYADERCRDAARGGSQPRLKPTWSPHYLLSSNYVGRAWCAAARLRERAGLSIAVCQQTSDYDRVLRLTEAAVSIHHVPLLLLTQGDGTADTTAQERTALQQAVKRRSLNAELENTISPGVYRLRHRMTKRQLVSVIIPTCGARGLIRRAIATLREKTAYRPLEIICVDSIPDHEAELKAWLREHVDQVLPYAGEFNWSRGNNLAARVANGRYLLFLNDDVEIIDRHWLHALVEQAQQPDVAIAGACLLYPDGTIQHAGMFVDGKVGRHAFRHAPAASPGPFGLAAAQREVLAVTGACMLMRREVFDDLGGFDERHRIINNDLDFCLRAQRAGLRVIYTPHAKLLHHECASRQGLGEVHDEGAFARDWHVLWQKGDPYFHPALSIERDDYTPDAEPVELVDPGRPLLAQARVHEILVIKLDHLGDFILSLPALRRLRQIFPQARISLLGAPATADLVALEPVIDRFIPFALATEISAEPWRALQPRDHAALRLALAPYSFDIAIDLRQQSESRAVLQLTGARLLAGFDHRGQFPWLDIALEWEGDRPRTPKRTHVSDRLLHLVDAVGLACAPPDQAMSATQPGDPHRLRQLLGPQRPAALLDRPLVCVHPGGGSEMKLWPAESYAGLINLLVAETGVSVVLIGLEREKEILAPIMRQVQNPAWVHWLAGGIGLDDLPALLRASVMLVGNDSFPKHLAARLGLPTVGIHGSHVDPQEWAAAGPLAVTIRRNVACGPCYITRPDACHRSVMCLRSIPVSAVFRVCLQQLQLAQGG